MQHTTEELILAAHVRELAATLHARKLEVEMQRWEMDNPEPTDNIPIAYTEAERQTKSATIRNQSLWRANRSKHKAQWLALNKVASSTKDALAMITEIADAIKAT